MRKNLNIDYEPLRTDKRLEKISRVLSRKQPDITVVLENINDPHNFSAVLRTCDATGILEVNAVYHSGQPFPRLGEKSSASARKWIDVKRYDTIEECYQALRNEGKKIFTTDMTRNSVSLYDLDLTQPVALVFGNEHAGVSKEASELSDGNFLIPQVGMIQSLNISVACAVSLYEVYRQRMEKGMYDSPQLSPELYKLYYDKWCGK